MSEHAECVGNRIKKLRSQMGMTQHQLAAKIGIGGTSISPIEAGKFLPNTKALLAMAKIFNISVEQLSCNEEDVSDVHKIAKAIEAKESFSEPLRISPSKEPVLNTVTKPSAPLIVDEVAPLKQKPPLINNELLQKFYFEFKDIYDLNPHDKMLLKLMAMRLMGGY